MVLTVFEIDMSTPHQGIQVVQGAAVRNTNGGWITMRSTAPLSASNHQWGVKILDQGEGADGSGLMLGLVPKHPNTSCMMGTKYISELGGWCLSRAGESYGAWKCERMPFETGNVVEFDVDVAAKSVHIVCGKHRALGHIPALAEGEEYFPAFSLYYLNQRVMFV